MGYCFYYAYVNRVLLYVEVNLPLKNLSNSSISVLLSLSSSLAQEFIKKIAN